MAVWAHLKLLVNILGIDQPVAFPNSVVGIFKAKLAATANRTIQRHE